jgi:predicted  nucleic acid-binding Zn-ribbon protein
MANLSFHLYQLQKIDLRVDQIDARVNKIDDLMHYNQALNEADQLVKESEASLKQKKQELAELESAAAAKTIKIEQSEAALYQGANKSPKELSDLQKEIASLKRIRTELEEQQFFRLSEEEALTTEFEERRKVFDGIFEEWQKDNQSLFSELETLKKEKEKLLTERQAVIGQISADSLATYEKLKASKNRIAVTSIEDESCTICGAEITAENIQKAKNSSTLITCPSCGRILYSG